jgi:hypothetical protein
MTAPLLVRLEASLNESAEPAVRAELAVQIASYLARVGEFDRADALRQDIRGQFGSGQYGRVSIRLMALDALLLYYRELSPSARDRMLRANLIASALRIPDLRALTTSWLAHIDFNLNRFTEMAKWLSECFAELPPDDSSSKLRASLVLGDAFLFADAEPQARAWYEKARRLASELGDQAAFGAITYNRAALHVTTARLRQMSNALSPNALALIDGEVRSAVNYQQSAGLRSLDHLLTSIAIGSHILGQNWSAAGAAISSLRESGQVADGTGAMALLLADEALCAAKSVGGAEEKRRLLEIASLTPKTDCSTDDLVLIYSSIARGYESIGDDEKKQHFLELCGEAISEHGAVVLSLRELLEPYASPQ